MSMHYKKTIKKYVYERDNHKCFFCNKELLFKQVSLDHYLPKSKGGPDNVCNIILSCKKCNKYKKNTIPNDYKEVMIDLFKKAVEDKIILTAGIRLKQKDLENISRDIYRIEHIGEYIVFQSNIYRLYVKNDKLYKIVDINVNLKKK